MDRFTNGELDALIAAVNHVLDVGLVQSEERNGWLKSAKVKLEAQRKAQE